MKKETKSLIKSYGIVSAFVFLVGFLFPPMIFHSNPTVYPMNAIYSGFFTLIAAWVFLIAGRVIQYNMNKAKPETQPKPEIHSDKGAHFLSRKKG